MLTGITTYEIICQAIGIIAAIISLISYQFKKNKSYLILQAAASAIFTIQFGMLNAWAAMLLNGICFLRAIVFAFVKFKNKNSNLIVCIIISLLNISCALIAALVFKELWYIALIIGLAQVAGTIAIYTDNPKVIRWVQLCFVSPCWLFNNIFYLSIGGIITESCNIVSVIISLIRIKLDENKEKVKTKE